MILSNLVCLTVFRAKEAGLDPLEEFLPASVL